MSAWTMQQSCFLCSLNHSLSAMEFVRSTFFSIATPTVCRYEFSLLLSTLDSSKLLSTLPVERTCLRECHFYNWLSKRAYNAEIVTYRSSSLLQISVPIPNAQNRGATKPSLSNGRLCWKYKARVNRIADNWQKMRVTAPECSVLD